MNTIFVQRGDAIDFTPSVDVAAGDVIVRGELVGVAKLDIKANTLGALHVCGAFDFPKETGVAIGAGAKVYWDEAAKVATEDPLGGVNKYLGKSTVEAAAEALTLRVLLDQ